MGIRVARLPPNHSSLSPISRATAWRRSVKLSLQRQIFCGQEAAVLIGRDPQPQRIQTAGYRFLHSFFVCVDFSDGTLPSPARMGISIWQSSGTTLWKGGEGEVKRRTDHRIHQRSRAVPLVTCRSKPGQMRTKHCQVMGMRSQPNKSRRESCSRIVTAYTACGMVLFVSGGGLHAWLALQRSDEAQPGPQFPRGANHRLSQTPEDVPRPIPFTH